MVVLLYCLYTGLHLQFKTEDEMIEHQLELIDKRFKVYNRERDKGPTTLSERCVCARICLHFQFCVYLTDQYACVVHVCQEACCCCQGFIRFLFPVKFMSTIPFCIHKIPPSRNPV